MYSLYLAPSSSVKTSSMGRTEYKQHNYRNALFLGGMSPFPSSDPLSGRSGSSAHGTITNSADMNHKHSLYTLFSHLPD
jgi:hypothetical protein